MTVGAVQTETFAGSSGSITNGTKYFKTVTQVAVDAATAGAVTVGVLIGAVSPTLSGFKTSNHFAVGVGCITTGTVTYNVQAENWPVKAEQQAGAKVLLLGMQLPPNYGARYTRAFAAVYSELGKEKNVALVPFLLEGVGGKPELMQADRIHPAVGAQGLLLDNVWPALKPLL